MIPTRKFFAFSAILASALAARAQTLVVDPGAYYTFTGEQYIGIADEDYYEEYYASAAVNGTLTLTAAQNLEIDRQSDYNSKTSMNIGSTGVFNSIGQTNFYAGKVSVYGIFNHTDSVLNIGNSDVKAQLYVQSGGTLNASDIQVLNATYSNLRVEGTVNAYRA